MSGHQWTPGPWVIREGANSHVFQGRLSPASAEDATIAFVDLDSPDARLIAAAPDLAEALEAMIHGLPELLESIGYADEEGMIEKAQAALAKAHGQ